MGLVTPIRKSRGPEELGLELARLFGNAPLGIAQCGPDGMVTAMNSVMEQILGADFNGPRYFGEYIHAEDRGRCERLLRAVLLGERESFQVENRIVTSDGGTRPVRWTAWAVSSLQPQAEVNRAEFGLLVAEDMSGSRYSEHRRREAEKLEAVGRLAGSVAHDFNNLLTGVILYCDLLLGGLEPASGVRRYAEEIRAAGMQATGVARQLLSVARRESSEPQLLSLNRIIEGMRDLLTRLTGEHVQLGLQLDPDLGQVRMDPTQVQQMLMNLVLNARDAMPQGGRVTIETSNCNLHIFPGADSEDGHGGETAEQQRMRGQLPAAPLPCVLLAVSDTGQGIEPAVREHIFEAFFTTKAAGNGTGLGLATVYDIVTHSGGLIRAESEPGRGSRFTVLLPLLPADRGGNPAHAERLLESSGQQVASPHDASQHVSDRASSHSSLHTGRSGPRYERNEGDFSTNQEKEPTP